MKLSLLNPPPNQSILFTLWATSVRQRKSRRTLIFLMSVKVPCVVCGSHEYIFSTLITIFLFLVKSRGKLFHCSYWSLIALLVSICHKVRVNFSTWSFLGKKTFILETEGTHFPFNQTTFEGWMNWKWDHEKSMLFQFFVLKPLEKYS